MPPEENVELTISRFEAGANHTFIASPVDQLARGDEHSLKIAAIWTELGEIHIRSAHCPPQSAEFVPHGLGYTGC